MPIIGFGSFGGNGSSYINGVVPTSADLPTTVGNPPMDSVYLAKVGSGVWLINRKPAGLYCRTAENGNAADWTYLGAFPEVNADGNWELYNTTDPTKELKFDVSGVSSGTTRTIKIPDKDGTMMLQDDPIKHIVYNNSGAAIPKGKVVYLFGSQGQRTTVRLADNSSDTTSARTFGITAEAISDNSQGFVVTEGVLEGVSTSGLADGTALWLGSNGAYVGTRPTQPLHGVFVGIVVKGTSAGAGSIFVKIANGQELDELHDVLISSPAANQILARNTGNTLWENTGSPVLDKVTINDTANDESTLILANDAGSNKIEFVAQELTLQHTGGNTTPYVNITDGTDYALLGLRSGEMFFQGSNPVVRIEQGGGDLADIAMRKALLDDAVNGTTVTFDAQNKITADRTYDLPDRSGQLVLDSQIFDFYYASAPSGATGGSGTWTWNIPSWSTYQVVVMIGAGGGGGSGRVGASGTVCGGGGGGGGGGYCVQQVRITGGAQIEVLVGSGGAGGAARGPAIANGATGSVGGVTRVRWVTPNIILQMSGGGGLGVFGGGGTTALGTSGSGGVSVGNSILGTGAAGGNAVSGSLTANAGSGSSNDSTQGGRQGGSISATPAAFNGGGLGSGTPFTSVLPQFLLPTVSPQFGTAGTGGNASLTANGGNGGNAGQIGGGGGGGAAALDGFLSGAGGNGGNGFVRIICF